MIWLSTNYKAQWVSLTLFEGLSSYLFWSRSFYGYTTQEASHYNRSTIPSPARAMSHLQSEVTDWHMVTTPQKHLMLRLPP